MKKFVTILLLASTLLTSLVSCKKGENTHSPEITIYNAFVNWKEMKSDTIYVGDTLSFRMLLNPFYDRIEHFNVTTDRTFLKDSIFSNEDFEKFCDATFSDKSKGLYELKTGDGVALVISPLFVALKSPETETHKVQIVFELKSSSTCSSDYNPAYVVVNVTVMEKEKETETEKEEE